MLDIITEQTLNQDGMVTSVEFSCGECINAPARIKSPQRPPAEK
jgi:hypothetical protein